jgi:hypothetical protein
MPILDLLAWLGDRVIVPAEQKAKELEKRQARVLEVFANNTAPS